MAKVTNLKATGGENTGAGDLIPKRCRSAEIGRRFRGLLDHDGSNFLEAFGIIEDVNLKCCNPPLKQQALDNICWKLYIEARNNFDKLKKLEPKGPVC